MDDHNGSGRVQRDLGILRGEMNGVQSDIKRVEKKVEDGFLAVTAQIQALRDDRSFAKGAGYVVTGLIAAVVSALMVFLGKYIK